MNNLFLTILLLVVINSFGYLYSYLIVTGRIGSNNQIQPKSNRDKKYFDKHKSLFLINVLILMFFVFLGFYFFEDFIIDQTSSFSFFNLFFHLLVILIFDDTFFYFLHRFMHENKYVYYKIHKIHHEANSPIPIDYIYVHPLEWMSGFIGPFIGILILGGVNIYTFWLYLIIRNLHELDIHSGIKSSFLNKTIPFAGTNEHHDKHHALRNGNYSSTFTFWDIIFKTKI